MGLVFHNSVHKPWEWPPVSSLVNFQPPLSKFILPTYKYVCPESTENSAKVSLHDPKRANSKKEPHIANFRSTRPFSSTSILKLAVSHETDLGLKPSLNVTGRLQNSLTHVSPPPRLYSRFWKQRTGLRYEVKRNPIYSVPFNIHEPSSFPFLFPPIAAPFHSFSHGQRGQQDDIENIFIRQTRKISFNNWLFLSFFSLRYSLSSSYRMYTVCIR